MLDAVIDISHHNGLALDFHVAAASGIRGIIHKATQGVSNIDPTLSTNRPGILAAGLMFGSYHFGDGSDGGLQAKHYLSVAKPAARELVALDLENNLAGPSMTIEEARAFVTTIHNEIGKWPVLYSGHTLKEMLGTRPTRCWRIVPYGWRSTGRRRSCPPGGRNGRSGNTLTAGRWETSRWPVSGTATAIALMTAPRTFRVSGRACRQVDRATGGGPKRCLVRIRGSASRMSRGTILGAGRGAGNPRLRRLKTEEDMGPRPSPRMTRGARR